VVRLDLDTPDYKSTRYVHASRLSMDVRPFPSGLRRVVMSAEGGGRIDGGEVDGTRLGIWLFVILLLTRVMFLCLIQRVEFVGVETILSRLGK
jgi:hypothetical protein